VLLLSKHHHGELGFKKRAFIERKEVAAGQWRSGQEGCEPLSSRVFVSFFGWSIANNLDLLRTTSCTF
jgi:hypothetical protein